MDELITDKIFYSNNRQFLVHIGQEKSTFEDARFYRSKLGNGWYMANINHPLEILEQIELPIFWIYDLEAIETDKRYKGIRCYSKHWKNPIVLGGPYQKELSVYIKEII